MNDPSTHSLKSLSLAMAMALLSACGGGSGSSASSQVSQQSSSNNLRPTVSFTANPTHIDSGQSSTLNWSTENASSCSASGDWSGIKGISGTFNTGSLSQNASYTINCSGDGGGVIAEVSVAVNSNKSASVLLSANPPGVAPNGSTLLSWSSENVTSCAAGGGWSGNKAISGSQSVGPINQDTSYELRCSGPQGNAVALTTVTLRVASFAWDVPTRNSDGSDLIDLDGYRLHWGNQSRQYDHSLLINDPAATSRTIELAPGTYYFAVTALNRAGAESRYSNELSKTIL